MSGLDPIGRKQSAELMLELRRQGKTIFFSTHILADVEYVCDRIGMIVKGELAYTGRLEDILSAATDHYVVIFHGGDGPPPILSGLEESATQRGRYRLAVRPADLGEIMRLVLQAGAEIISIEPKRVRLEDVFMRLTRKE
jgi:ABC-2 type transport system ATP-binding protein